MGGRLAHGVPLRNLLCKSPSRIIQVTYTVAAVLVAADLVATLEADRVDPVAVALSLPLPLAVTERRVDFAYLV